MLPGMRRSMTRCLMMTGLAVVALGAAAVPASAQRDGREHRDEYRRDRGHEGRRDRGHEGRREWGYEGRREWDDRYRYRGLPPPVYYQPRPAYVPPPVYYYGPPRSPSYNLFLP